MMRYSRQNKIIRLNQEGDKLKSLKSESQIRNYSLRMDGDTKACITRSRILGKWFFAAGSPEMVMALWEIKP
jgi:hypothetical protein